MHWTFSTPTPTLAADLHAVLSKARDAFISTNSSPYGATPTPLNDEVLKALDASIAAAATPEAKAQLTNMRAQAVSPRVDSDRRPGSIPSNGKEYTMVLGQMDSTIKRACDQAMDMDAPGRLFVVTLAGKALIDDPDGVPGRVSINLDVLQPPKRQLVVPPPVEAGEESPVQPATRAQPVMHAELGPPAATK